MSKSLVGTGGLPQVRDDELSRAVYATDNSIYQRMPSAVALPATVSELIEVVASNFSATRPKPIVARGGGTGTNGQSLTDGILIDTKRHLNQVTDIDAANRLAVVEPGVVADELNRMLEPHNLFWAPHASTQSRATVGGMIATDAAGKGSMVHGRTNAHVVSLDLVLADGSLFKAEPVTPDEARRRADGGGSAGRVWAALLALDISEESEFNLPELARGFSGYGIDRLYRDGLIDPVPLIVGSEGTLGVVTSATLRLTPLPTSKRLMVGCYESFDDALADAVVLRSTGPSAIETFDERTLEAGKRSPAWSALDHVVPAEAQSLLLMEFADFDDSGAADLTGTEAELDRLGRCRASIVIDDPVQQAAAWRVRADAVGLLAKVEVGGPRLSARPTAFVEDCAVPVTSMQAFISDFRSILDDHDLTYAMFGHADVGCVHVRPALDTTDPEHERLVSTITSRVVDAVNRHGGLLWGEHGRGLRSASVEQFLATDVIDRMRQVKTAFDPDDLCNPGKLYRPVESSEPLLAVDDVPLRGHSNRLVPVHIRRDFSDAFACNGNGVCHHHHENEVMCPSYQATRDQALSPKGRADLIRHWLAGSHTSDRSATDQELFEEGLAENLGQCLSCSACTGRCPVEVDIPELKSRFLEDYYSTRRRPLAHLALAQFERGASLAARAPTIANIGLWPASRVLGLVDLPSVPALSTPPAMALTDRKASDELDLVVVPDVFSAVLDPDLLANSCQLLERLGYRIAVADFVPSGKFDHVKGRRKAFAKAVRRQAKLLRRIADIGARAVVLEPATSLLHLHEYPNTFAGYPNQMVVGLASVVAERADRLSVGSDGSGKVVRLLGHCTEQATSAEWLSDWSRCLSAAGFEVDAGPVGCCGMAGVFGHERTNQDLSRAVWDSAWANEIETAGFDDTMVAATGYSCRTQAARMSGIKPRHPVDLLI